MSSKTVGSYYNDSVSDEHEEWKRGVLKDYYNTKDDINKLIKSSENSRKKIEKICEDCHSLKGVWDDFEEKYAKACNRLTYRIDLYDEEECERRSKKWYAQPSLKHRMLTAYKQKRGASTSATRS